MKLTATQLRKIIKEEVSKVTTRRGRLSEGHARITEEEFAQWKSGNWGFVAEDHHGLTLAKDDDSSRFLHGSDEGHPMDDEGYMVKSRMASMKKMAADICGLLDSDDQLPGWVQDLVATSHNDLQHVHDYLMGDEEMRSYVSNQPGVAEALVGGATKRMSGGRPESEMVAAKSKDPKKEQLRKDIAFQKAQIQKAKSGKLKGQNLADMQAHLEDLQAQLKTESRRRGAALLEGHARITEEEFAAWKSGDWGFVSEHDGGGPRRRSMDVIPADPDKLRDYIIRNYEGVCVDLGCEDVSDPEFKEYVSDQLAGKVDSMTLKTALAMM